MTADADCRQLAREAKAIVALAFRNGPIEAAHAGMPCPTCSLTAGYSRITDPEMKVIMKNAVDRVYALLRLKIAEPDRYAKEIAYGADCAANWDEPTGLLNSRSEMTVEQARDPRLQRRLRPQASGRA